MDVSSLIEGLYWYIITIKNSIFHKFTSYSSSFCWLYFILAYGFYFLCLKCSLKKFSTHFRSIGWKSNSLLLDVYIFILIIPIVGYLANTKNLYFVFNWLGVNVYPPNYVEPIFSNPSVFIKILWAIFGLFFIDLLHYFAHRIFHSLPFLWEFHKVHHSAKDLFFITNYRFHFVDGVAIYGAEAIGVVLWTYFSKVIFAIDEYQILVYGVPALIILRKFYSVLAHSTCWIVFPRWLSHIIMSPAMHQIHHSVDEKHYGKNISGKFSIWDWCFGTLYIPSENENKCLSFGLIGEEKIEKNFRAATFLPFFRSSKIITSLAGRYSERFMEKITRLRDQAAGRS